MTLPGEVRCTLWRGPWRRGTGRERAQLMLAWHWLSREVNRCEKGERATVHVSGGQHGLRDVPIRDAVSSYRQGGARIAGGREGLGWVC